jgi:Phage integrase, N-terminal SAM-like domain
VHIELFRASMEDRGLAASTIDRRLSTVRGFYRFAPIDGRIRSNNTAANPGVLPAEIETAAMTRLRQESHARMLGNGLCTRPAELDCRMESACETCAYFMTGPEFVPVLLRQRDHARDHHQPQRAAILDQLLDQATEAPA